MQSKVIKAIIILILYINIFPQEKVGQISYQSSQFVYVKFDNTDGINKNDTLFIKNSKSLIPALKTVFVSSRSCACTVMGNMLIKPGDKIIAAVKENLIESESSEVIENKGITAKNTPPGSAVKERVKPSIQNLSFKNRLRLSVQSYSTLSNVQGYQDRQQWRYLLSSEIHPLGNVPLSLSTYFTYRYRPGEPERNKISRSLNVYDLSLKYNFNEDFNIVLGRNINKYISNISSIDGLQLNKNWGETAAGIILGSRPDLNFSSGVNLKLFEAGAYVARTDSILKGTMDNTFAFFEQMNSFKTDRRFIYFQHSNSIFEGFYNFISTEVDLYLRERGKAKNAFNLMNLYVISRYSITRSIGLSLSYDNRKNIIYYESFKNGLDSLIDRETRQGIRAGLDIRPHKQVYFTISGGYNFKKSDIKPSRNLLTGISFINITVVNINTNLHYSVYENNYINGNIYGINLSKELFNGFIYPSIGYRRSEYKMNFSNKSFQNFFSCDLSIRLINKLFLSLNYELEYQEKTSYNRLLIDLSSRF